LVEKNAKRRNIKYKSKRCVVNAVIRSVGDNVKARRNNQSVSNSPRRRAAIDSLSPQPGSPLGEAAPGAVQAKGSEKKRLKRKDYHELLPPPTPPHKSGSRCGRWRGGIDCSLFHFWVLSRKVSGEWTF
jgi:hypothetical protein